MNSDGWMNQVGVFMLGLLIFHRVNKIHKCALFNGRPRFSLRNVHGKAAKNTNSVGSKTDVVIQFLTLTLL